MQESTYIFEKMPIPRAIRTMAIPIIISQLIVLIYNIADTFFIGKTNNPYMVAGASLILPVFNIAIAVSGLAGSGGGSLISRLLGEKREKEAQKVFSFSFYLALVLSALVSLLTLVFHRSILELLGAGDEIYSFALTYLFFVVTIGGIPTVLSNTLSTLIRSVGESAKAGFGITMGGVINIFLDPLFMFVLFPPGQEILGASVATCLSNFIALFYFLIVIHRSRNNVLKITNPLKLPTRSSLESVFAVGIPSGLATLLFDVDYMVIDRLMTNYHAIALAAIGIVLKAERLPLNVGIGICQGMLPVVAYNYSAHNYKRMNGAKNYSLKIGIIFSVVSVILYELFASQIMRIFISDSQTVELGTQFLKIRVLATPFMFISFFYVFVFNSFGRGMYALLLGVMRWLGLNIPMLFLLDHLLGINGIVWAQLVADMINVCFSLLVYNFYIRRHLTEIRS